MINHYYFYREQENDTSIAYLQTNYSVSHLEPDFYVRGNLLFSMNQALLSTDGTYQDLIVGQPEYYPYNSPKPIYREGVGRNAVFSDIPAFTQINKTHIIVADSKHGCVRSVNRLTNATQRIAGQCKEINYLSSYKDGSLDTATFHFISSIVIYNQVIYVSHDIKRAIRKIDLKTGDVTTLANYTDFGAQQLPKTLVVDAMRQTIFISTLNAIAKIDLRNDNFSYISKGRKWSPNARSVENTTWSGAGPMARLSDDYLLVISQRFRIIDLKTMTVDTWCFMPEDKSKSCPPVYMPLSPITVMSCTVYFSSKVTIHSLSLPTWFCEQDHIKSLGLTTGTTTPSKTGNSVCSVYLQNVKSSDRKNQVAINRENQKVKLNSHL